MINVFSKYIIFFLGIFLLSEIPAQREWTSKRNKNGVEVLVKDAENTKLKTYKAIGSTKASIDDCVAFLLDLENHINWSYTVVESKLISEENNKSICYMVMDAPWPVDDRDIVVEVTTKKISESKVKVTLEALSGEKEEVKGVVRVTESTTTWLFERIDGTTHITYLGLSDPGGNIPEWMVNALLVDGPYETLRNFIDLVGK